MDEDDSLSMGTNEITVTLSKLRRKSTHNMLKMSQAISNQMKGSERGRNESEFDQDDSLKMWVDSKFLEIIIEQLLYNLWNIGLYDSVKIIS